MNKITGFCNITKGIFGLLNRIQKLEREAFALKRINRKQARMIDDQGLKIIELDNEVSLLNFQLDQMGLRMQIEKMTGVGQ